MSKKESTKKSKSRIKKIKKQISKKEEESELEREIKEEDLKTTQAEEIEEEQFTKFTQPSVEPFSPVLERIETPQQEPLEDNLASVTTPTEKKDEEKIKYETGYIEPNYEDMQKRQRINENLLVQESAPINFETTRIDLHPHLGQNFQINPELQELRKQSQGDLEKDYIVKEEKLNRGNNNLPFEQTQRKYKGKSI